MERALGIEYGMSLSARCVSRGWQRRVYLWVKRAQDMALSALALVLLSPLMVLIALAVVVDDPHGSPIFSQLRCGRGGKKVPPV